MERKETKRANIQAERATLSKLKALIYQIADLCGLDEDKMSRRIEAALQSEYGRTNGMINLLASVAHWPAEAGDGSAVAENRRLIEEKLGLDLLMLADIRGFRGYHTFHTDELETIAGVEPNYEDYEDYVAIFLEDLKLTPQRVGIDRAVWQRQEIRAKEQTAKTITELAEAVEKHKAFLENLGH